MVQPLTLRPSDIPRSRVRALESGEAETRSLAEGLAIDARRLAQRVLPPDVFAATDGRAWGLGVVRRSDAVGEAIARVGGDALIHRLAGSPSDTIRGWVCFAIAAQPDRTLRQRLTRMRPLADDGHFGVREWAWLALRPQLIEALGEALSRLTPWTRSRSANLRRFAIEATRPRGVWCAHIVALKEDPTPGLALLEPLRADASRYVQDSVANWLNDAAKSRPDWVRGVCDRWRVESPAPETEHIIRRATRNL